MLPVFCCDKGVKIIALYWKYIFVRNISQSCLYSKITSMQMPPLLEDIRALVKPPLGSIFFFNTGGGRLRRVSGDKDTVPSFEQTSNIIIAFIYV